MAKRQLNAGAVKQALHEKGLNQSKFAKELGVSREAVSQWLSGKSSPTPAHLLDLALLLQLDIDAISVPVPDADEPVIAFCANGNAAKQYG